MKLIKYKNDLMCFFSGNSEIANKNIKFLTQKESIQELISSNKSLIRWGDGESSILMGGDLYFQKNSHTLRKYLNCAVKEYTENSDYLIAVPAQFLTCTNYDLKISGKYRLWMKTRYVFKFFFRKSDNKFLDAFIFREDSSLDNKLIERLWSSEKVIFFVHNNYKYYVDFKKNNPDKKVYFIGINSANSFAQMNKSIRKIISINKKHNFKKESFCCLISAGPAAKAYVIELSRIGFKSLDMGHYFDYKFYNIRR